MSSLTLDIVIFYLSAGLAVAAAFLMIWQRNPVASAMYLILSLVAQAALYIQLDAIFLAALLIIIYGGAIVTLFLFVIMLLNLRGEQFVDSGSRPRRAVKIVIASLIGAELVYITSKTLGNGTATGALSPAPENFGAVADVATMLYTKYLYAFEVTGILLLVAVVGAVVMAGKRANEEELS